MDRFDPDAFERITCSISTDFAGLTTFRLVSDPVNALLITAAIKRRNTPRPPGTAIDENGETVVVPDTRLPGQRTAEAMIELLLAGAGLCPATAENPKPDATTAPATATTRAAEVGDQDDPIDPDHLIDPAGLGDLTGGCDASGPTAGTAGVGAKAGQRPLAEVLIVARLGEVLAAQAADATSPAGRARAARAGLARMSLAGNTGTYVGSTIDPAVLAQLMCTSSLRRIIIDDREGSVLHHGRTTRLVTPPQRRALTVRDGGCVIPGCHAPPEWCDSHHTIPWSRGGTTDIDTMALLCRWHHTAHHAGVYDVQMRNGIPWVKVPAWIDRRRPWLRNTVHRHQHLIDDLVQQLTEPPDNGGD